MPTSPNLEIKHIAPPLQYRHIHSATLSGHGGNRRTLQVLDLFSRYGLECEVIQDKIKGRKIVPNVTATLRGLLPGLSAPFSRWFSPRGLRNYGLIRAIGKTIKVSKNSVVIFDAFICAYSTLFSDIHKRGGKIIIFPHNIDSLSPGIRHPISQAVSPQWADLEIAALAEADLVCCISREEQWLLSLHGINACYLPYEPTPEYRSKLGEIRRLRASQIKDVVLILGTATNIPTLRGMQEILKRAPDLAAAAKGLQIVVIGYGTEVLAPLVADENLPITILGGVSDEVLDNYLLRTKVNLAYQEGTTGMLTRIQELLYCGIPVIANNIAARSYQNVPGVVVTESIDEMLNVLTSFESTDFMPPEIPEKLEQQLVERIRQLQGFPKPTPII